MLGTHEVYRDPRQKRLNEIEAKQHAAVPKVTYTLLFFKKFFRRGFRREKFCL